jgi:cyclophilin family peptidyl-prolyl cis-trans isomerase
MLASVAALGGTLARIKTPLGEIDVELFDTAKPQTVQNFIQYVRSGAYKDLFIHRWEPGFVIQAGSFRTENRHSEEADFDLVPRSNAITNEFGVGQPLSNTYGTIAMAREPGATNSARADWFINLGDNSFLDSVDGGFTVFGRVLKGTNVLNRFNNVAETNGIYMAAVPGLFNRLPVLATPPTFNDLVYADITLLTARCKFNELGQTEISWTSVDQLTNRVEFTDQLPAVWNELTSTNGTGHTLRVVDPATIGNSRLYRIRVDY